MRDADKLTRMAVVAVAVAVADEDTDVERDDEDAIQKCRKVAKSKRGRM